MSKFSPGEKVRTKSMRPIRQKFWGVEGTVMSLARVPPPPAFLMSYRIPFDTLREQWYNVDLPGRTPGRDTRMPESFLKKAVPENDEASWDEIEKFTEGWNPTKTKEYVGQV